MWACHDDIGYLGINHTLNLLPDRFYWPDMKLDVEQHIKTCGQCLHFKAKPQCAELHPILAKHPLELVHIDFLTVESGKGDKEINILVVTDHFTRYVQAYVPVPNFQSCFPDTEGQLFHALWTAEKIVSDQGCNFESSLISELCTVSQIKKLHTMPYWPHTNG